MTTVHVYPADLGGCGHYRLAWPAQALQALGHDVVLFPPGEVTTVPVSVLNGKVFIRTGNLPDVLVIQRPLHWMWSQAIPRLREKGVRVVVDIDDDLNNLHGSHCGFWDVHPKGNPVANYRWMERALDVADLVTVTTPALAARYASHGRWQLIRNYVPAVYLTVEHPRHERVAVGWSGTVATHPGDLNVVGNALARAQRKTGFDFLQIGEPEGVERALGLKPVHVPWVPIQDYPTALAQFDVGIVPLAISAFNQAKSYLKGLEMAAVGVPFVASPTEAYSELAARGVGDLAANPKEWERAIRRLVEDEAYRAERAADGRERAMHLTIEGNVHHWEHAWLQC